MGQSTYERDRDPRGFKELAKLAGQTRPRAGSISGVRRTPEPDENDSGMVDLAVLASADPGAVDRASVTPLASSPLFEDEPQSSGRLPPGAMSSGSALPAAPSGRLSAPPPVLMVPAAPASARPIVSVPRASSVPHVQATLRSGSSDAAAIAAAVRPQAQRRSTGRIAAVIGLAAIAAGSFLVVRTLHGPPSVATGPATEVTQTVTHEAPAQAPATKSAIAQSPAADHGVDPLSLPVQTTIVSTGKTARADARRGHGTHAAQVDAKTGAKAEKAESQDDEAPVAAVATKPAAAPETKEAAAAPAPAANNTLLGLIAQSAAAPAAAPAAGTTEAVTPPVTPAAAPASGSGLVPRPSQGQVTTALGGVIPAARACLSDDDGVSRAHVVFGSDGAVQSVAITGFAAGKPAEACIKTALGKAHVPAFAEASYGATVTVRP